LEAAAESLARAAGERRLGRDLLRIFVVGHEEVVAPGGKRVNAMRQTSGGGGLQDAADAGGGLIEVADHALARGAPGRSTLAAGAEEGLLSGDAEPAHLDVLAQWLDPRRPGVRP